MVQERTYLKVSEAAKLSGVSTETIRNWYKSKKITGYQTPGGRVMVDRDSLNIPKERYEQSKSRKV